jgi:hypothetical protein
VRSGSRPSIWIECSVVVEAESTCCDIVAVVSPNSTRLSQAASVRQRRIAE